MMDKKYHTCLKGELSWLLSISMANNIDPSPGIERSLFQNAEHS